MFGSGIVISAGLVLLLTAILILFADVGPAVILRE
jgi:hypothetical protein